MTNHKSVTGSDWNELKDGIERGFPELVKGFKDAILKFK
jgi:hypothetical protein